MSESKPWKLMTQAWDRFWFREGDPTTLGVIRILAGAIIFYTHVVWTFEFHSFFRADELLSVEHNRQIVDSAFAWSHFHWMSIDTAYYLHFAVLAVMGMFCLGIFTRITGVLTAFFTISYAHRATGATFGLDQINVMLAFYLAIGPSGAAFSLDRWWQSKRTEEKTPARFSVGAHLTTRLIQVHLSIIYLFAGFSKLLGSSWWNGEAIWGAVANAEYQTLDLTWLAAYPVLLSLITHFALVWEVSYVFLVWNRYARPFVIGIAFCIHLGIGIGMGMMEFGLIMAVANLSFVKCSVLRTWMDSKS